MWSLLRRNRDFRRLFVAQLISYAGDWFATVAAIGLLLDQTGSDLLASLFWVAQSLPTFLMGPIAGPVADRFDRRKILVGVSAAQAVAALGFLVAGGGAWWMVFVAQGLVTALGSFFGPASQAGVANVVDLEDLPTATSMMAATWGAMLAVGAAVGAGFTVAFGREAAFVADAATFAVAAAIIASIRRPMQASDAPLTSPVVDEVPAATAAEALVEDVDALHVAVDAAAASAELPETPTRMRPLKDMAEAVRYARDHHEVLALLASHVGFALGSGVVGMLAVLATKRYGAGDGGTGLLLTARGIGVLLGPLLIRRQAAKGMHAVILAAGFASLGYGVAYLGVAAAPTLALAFVLVAVAHLGGGAQWALTTYGLQFATPDALRGRVFAASFSLVTLSMSLSLLLAGLLGGRIGPAWTIAVIAAISTAWGTSFLIATRGLRERLRPDEDPAGPAGRPRDGEPPGLAA